MKYLRKFASEADYNAFKDSDSYVTPNVVLVNGKVDYNPPPPLPLYIEAIQNLTVKFGNTYEYSKDNKTWTSGTSSTTISANAGEKVFFRASGLTASSSSGIGSFSIFRGDCNVGGNVMSMVYGADFKGKTEITQTYQFYRLFYSSSSTGGRIVDASGLALPATAMTNYCYSAMFCNQLKLTSAPALPATTLASYCYNQMFYGCTNLVNAPALPATTLASYCYYYMFDACESLINAPALPATTLASYCYKNMFSGCISLVSAPTLPATTLVNSCYDYMFYGCSNLSYIKAMFTTTPSSSYLSNWVSGVSASGTFVKNSAATWTDTFGVSAIPEGWTVELADA